MKYTEERMSDFVGYIERGVSIKTACRVAGIDHKTYRNWYLNKKRRKELSNFSTRIKEAEAKCRARNEIGIQKAGEMTWQARAWYLERKYPKEYGRREYIQEQRQNLGGLEPAEAARIAKEFKEIFGDRITDITDIEGEE